MSSKKCRLADKGVPVVVFPLGWRWVPGRCALDMAQREAEAQVRRQRQVRAQRAGRQGEVSGMRG